jgi:hypothetical protein
MGLHQKEGLMHCTLRQYEDCDDIPELATKIEKELLPTLRDMPGYVQYFFVDCGDGGLMTFSLFETQEQAESANEEVAKLVQLHLSSYIVEEPEITVGEVLIENHR